MEGRGGRTYLVSTLRSDMAGYNISGEGGGVDWILMKTATAKSSHDFECLLECLQDDFCWSC